MYNTQGEEARLWNIECKSLHLNLTKNAAKLWIMSIKVAAKIRYANFCRLLPKMICLLIRQKIFFKKIILRKNLFTRFAHFQRNTRWFHYSEEQCLKRIVYCLFSFYPFSRVDLPYQGKFQNRFMFDSRSIPVQFTLD